MVTSPIPCRMSMLVSQPSTSTITLGETGGKVGVSVGVGASVKAVAVSLGVTAVAVSVGVSVGVSEMGAGVVVLVIVKITGVGEKMDGVMVGGGAGKVGTV